MSGYKKLIFLPLSILLVCGYLAGLNVVQKHSADGNGQPALPARLEAALSEERQDFPIHLNQATAEELVRLDGVGEALAARIIEKREELGGFQRIEDLMQVRGIGETKFEEIKELITVE